MSGTNAAVDRVRFLAETNLIAEVTNPPFETWWRVQWSSPNRTNRFRSLSAVALSGSNIVDVSPPVSVVVFDGAPPFWAFGITSPKDGDILLSPATFTFSAELLARSGPDLNATQFYIGTNIVASFAQPPLSTVVSNLPKGTYSLTVKWMGTTPPEQPVINIRVADLAVSSVRLTDSDQIVVNMLTAYPGKPTVLQSSSDLRQWAPVSTNIPQSNALQIIDSGEPRAPNFYRLIVYP